MTHDEIVSLCQSVVSAWNAHDPAGVAACYAPDGTLRDVGGDTATGREEIKTRAQLYLDAFPDFQLAVVSIEADNNIGVTEWKASGTQTGPLRGVPPTSAAVVIEGCNVAHVEDDQLIHAETDYWNQASLQRQLGESPQATASA